MNKVPNSVVRKHFVVCQKSRECPTSFDKIKKEIGLLSDENIKEEIKNMGESNADFLNDDISWELVDINIEKCFSPYTDFRGLRYPKKDMSVSQIINFLKENHPECIDKMEREDADAIKKVLPIFAYRINDKHYVRDGWKRTLTLAVKNESEILAYCHDMTS